MQVKRPHPKFISPLMSSRGGGKHPRLTPTSTASLPTYHNPMGGSTPTKQGGEETTQPSTQPSALASQQPSAPPPAEAPPQVEQMAKLEQEKRLLEVKLSESEDKLRKLKMVKLYRNKVILPHISYDII